MSICTGHAAQKLLPVDERELNAPPWVMEWAHAGTIHSVTRKGVRALGAAEFEECVADVYRELLLDLRQRRHSRAVRIWSYIPDIHRQMDGGDRYMVFNSGRYAVMFEAFGQPGMDFAHLPAASAVGHDGDDLVIHCLAMERPGHAVENPRQVPAFCYSRRYGDRPPCFARATLVQRDDGLFLLAAGTASIVGEQTVHIGNLREQMSETVRNLGALLEMAMQSSPVRLSSPKSGAPREDEGISPVRFPAMAAPLAAFSDLRVYYPRVEDAAEIESTLRRMLSPGTRLEMFRADLCRADLLVEIEGLARLGDGRLA